MSSWPTCPHAGHFQVDIASKLESKVIRRKRRAGGSKVEREWQIKTRRRKDESRARFEEEQRDVPLKWERNGAAIASTPLSLPREARVTSSWDDVRSGLFIAVKNTSKCPPSAIRRSPSFSPFSLALWPALSFRAPSFPSRRSYLGFVPTDEGPLRLR